MRSQWAWKCVGILCAVWCFFFSLFSSATMPRSSVRMHIWAFVYARARIALTTAKPIWSMKASEWLGKPYAHKMCSSDCMYDPFSQRSTESSWIIELKHIGRIWLFRATSNELVHFFVIDRARNFFGNPCWECFYAFDFLLWWNHSSQLNLGDWPICIDCYDISVVNVIKIFVRWCWFWFIRI